MSNKGIKNRGSQVHHVKRGDLLAKEHAKEIADYEDHQKVWDGSGIERMVCQNNIGVDWSKLSQKQQSQLRSYGN